MFFQRRSNVAVECRFRIALYYCLDGFTHPEYLNICYSAVQKCCKTVRTTVLQK